MANALQNETSPYLLQHADNPVDWFPWNETALEKARGDDKPILLSVGYSACHWCHVMAHESFEDPGTAELMNRLFVNIKVDREERPDIDKIYQIVHQLIARRPGGWPLTVFLTPDSHHPIFAGTYFPKAARYGMPAFKEVLERVAAYYRDHADEIRSHGAALSEALASLDVTEQTGADALCEAPFAAARKRLAESFDGQYGGFGDAPKFPHPTHLETLLDVWRDSAQGERPDLDALGMVSLTLMRMAEGGLYDQLGGGFYRYSVDRYWLIPHFEKMLYDNAALLAVYSDAHAATGEHVFAQVAGQTADWVVREMQDERGGFYSTLDADSEGEEGKFYLWTPAEVEAVLDADESALVQSRYGLDEPANFERHAWHLRIARPLEEAAQANGVSAPRAAQLLEGARAKLLAARSARIRPARDEKVLTSWNALMIRGLALAARHLERPELAAAATRAVDFIRETLWQDGRLKATYKDGRARFAAYLDDHAFLALALLELLQCRWRSEDLAFARALADVLLARFEDPRGGFYFTAHDHEALLHRPKPFADDSLPAGNGMAVQALMWLGHLLGEQRYLAAAERALTAVWPLLARYPEAHGSLLRGLAAHLRAPTLIVVRAPAADLERWRRYLNAGYHPRRSSLCIPADERNLPGLLAERRGEGEAAAYVCRGTHCLAPVATLEELAALIGGEPAR